MWERILLLKVIKKYSMGNHFINLGIELRGNNDGID
jgi:hypothetical protein